MLLAIVGLGVGTTGLVVGAVARDGEAAGSGVVMLAIGAASAALWIATRRKSSRLRDDQ